MSLKMRTRKIDDVTVFDLYGRITSGEAQFRLRDWICRSIEEGDTRIVLNLGGVTYIDSAGLGELIIARKSLGERGGQINLLNLTKKVQDVLVVTKLAVVFDLFDDETNAVRAVHATIGERAAATGA